MPTINYSSYFFFRLSFECVDCCVYVYYVYIMYSLSPTHSHRSTFHTISACCSNAPREKFIWLQFDMPNILQIQLYWIYTHTVYTLTQTIHIQFDFKQESQNHTTVYRLTNTIFYITIWVWVSSYIYQQTISKIDHILSHLFPNHHGIFIVALSRSFHFSILIRSFNSVRNPLLSEQLF